MGGWSVGGVCGWVECGWEWEFYLRAIIGERRLFSETNAEFIFGESKPGLRFNLRPMRSAAWKIQFS